MFPFIKRDRVYRCKLNTIKSYESDEQGSIGVMFGLMVIPTILLVGVAVDIARIISVRNQTQAVLDNAALAGGRAAQLAQGNAAAAASAAAKAYFNAQTIPHAINAKISDTATPNETNTEFTWTVDTWVRTPFISSASIRNTKNGDGSSPQPCPVSGWFCKKVTVSTSALLTAGGKNKDNKVEVAMMLDVTGSMAGSKIADLKVAAKDLIDIVVQDNGGDESPRIALVPFAEAVNVGTALAPQVYGAVTPGTCNKNTSGCNTFQFNRAGGGGSTYTYKLSNSCVVERTNSGKWTDNAPSADPVGKFYPNSSGSCSLVSSSDSEINLAMPLSRDKAELKQRVDKLQIAGSTAGHIGTAWAWYMLSPKWGYLFPSSSKPAEYTDTKTQKIAVLMTDGDYNTQYCKGAESSDSYNPKINCAGDIGKADKVAERLCDEIKKSGITVYAVGFQVSSAAKALLRDKCATSTSHYYDATSGDALKQAFRDIALKISTLRISK